MGVRVFFWVRWIRFAESGGYVGCGSGAQVGAGCVGHVQVRPRGAVSADRRSRYDYILGFNRYADRLTVMQIDSDSASR